MGPLIFPDPCLSNPCDRDHSHCKKLSATEYECKCDSGYSAKFDEVNTSLQIELYGCEKKGNQAFNLFVFG